MKYDINALVASVKETALATKGGLSRGNLLKLGYEYHERTTGAAPTKEDKESIRSAIQKDLNLNGTIKSFEVVVSDKSYNRLTGAGELVSGRNIKTIDTRQKSLETQTKECWGLMSQHMEYRAKHPLYEGSEAEISKTTKLQNALYSRLWQLDNSEFKTRVTKQLEKWFPAAKSVADVVAPVTTA